MTPQDEFANWWTQNLSPHLNREYERLVQQTLLETSATLHRSGVSLQQEGAVKYLTPEEL